MSLATGGKAIDPAAFIPALDQYFDQRGWPHDGVPKRKPPEGLGLHEAARQLHRQRGIVVARFRKAFSDFFSHNGFFLAGGLSFYFLTCLIPLLFLTVSLAGYILSGETAVREVVGRLQVLLPVYQEEVTRALLRIVATRKLSGIVGTVILIAVSTQLFAAIRVVLNRILGVRERALWQVVLFDIAMVFVVNLLLVGTIAATAVFAWFKTFVFAPADIPAHWLESMTIGFALASSTMMYFIIYRFFPQRRIFWGAALAGALLAAVLWEVAKQLFRFYILTMGVYDRIYGPLGVLVAFVMFVYYSAVVFILGAECVGAFERRRPARG